MVIPIFSLWHLYDSGHFFSSMVYIQSQFTLPDSSLSSRTRKGIFFAGI